MPIYSALCTIDITLWKEADWDTCAQAIFYPGQLGQQMVHLTQT